MAACLQSCKLCKKSFLLLAFSLSFCFASVCAGPFDSAHLYHRRVGPNEDDIIVANNGIRVPFGRSVFLDPVNDLVTEVQPGDRCQITVLDNDPLAQKPGMLTPKKFPCSFGSEEVKYTHFGSRSPSKDRVKLQLRYDSHTDTVIVPFMLEVEVVFQQLEILTRNMPLNVEKLNGESNPIDKKGLEFSYEDGVTQCKISTLVGAGGLPRYGTLLNNPSNGQMVDCDEFVKQGIRYKHTAKTNSPNRDYIPMMVELQDNEGNMIMQEHFQMMVRIREGAENTAPKPSFVAMMMMEVDQFVMTAITSDMLSAEDVESHPDDLIFNITSPLNPQQGYIISTDDQNFPITSFYHRDVKELKIAYKPPSDDSEQERIFQLEFEIVDTDGAVSDPFAFMIVVKPMNTLAPVATKNTGQLLFEGQSRALSSSQNLEISDEDNLEDVRITVIDGLKHGDLTMLGTRRKFFTPADLDAGIVVYQHDGSDTYSDNIIFRMTDGSNEVEFLFPITIVPTDDEPPIINANTGLVLFKNEIMQISPFILSATDIDSEDSTIEFVVEAPYSTIGQLLLRQAELPSDPSLWKFSETDEMFEQVVTEWLQQDILDGKLFYRHIGPHSTTTVTDNFVFRVQDDNDPPNQSGEHTFTIKIHPVDDLAPELFPGTTLHMTVQEYELTYFRKKFLCYTDLDSDDRDLKYTITKPPTDTDENNPALLGEIVLTDSPDTVITEFTQAQVNHHKVAYKPPDQELGITPKVAQFTFTVEDTAGNTADGLFTIFLQPVDNKPPLITNTGFTVLERGTYVITRKELHATDTDTDDDNIIFTVTQIPQYGQLQYLGIDMSNGETFVLEDITTGRLTYMHGGKESLTDVIKLSVSDGFHEVPIAIRITIEPVDDKRPTIMLPPGLLGASIDVLENGATEITSNVIQGHDEDTDDLMLTFIVEEPPRLGEILVNGALAERFTQEDIINGVVVYAHTSGEIGPTKEHDSFNLTLSDMSEQWVVGGNKIQGVTVHVTILPVDSIPPVVSVGEQFIVVEGKKNVITLEQIHAEDVDTNSEDILCTIIVQPTSGYVENISPAAGSEKSRAGTAITAFAIKEISLGHIYYVQSIHKGVEPVEDRFTFRCSDGINFSERHFFPIVIIPANDEKPEIFVREFVVMEGMSLVIDTPILNAADADIPKNELHFEIIKPPKYGTIVQQLSTGTIPVEKFNLEQIIEASNIVYEHDDSETKEDSFEIRLSDGKHKVEKTVPIVVIPVDDETPRMAINDGLDVEIGETKVISNSVLKATDLDSEDKELTYVVRYGPGQGYLQRISKFGDVLGNITLGMNFTQDEIDRQLIQYVHTGQEGIRDLLKFDVTDGINPLIDRYFYISIGSIDMVFPDVVNKGVTLKEGGKVTLTTDLLSTSDINSPDEYLSFSITRAPSRGHLECTDLPGVPISTFTQLQLAGNKIYYIHTSDDEIKMDSFEFEVTDGYNPVFRTFRVSITDVDNKKPVLTITRLVVEEGESKLITPFELTAEDRDTPDHLLRFIITQVPVHGLLLFNNTQPITTFTKQDLNENLISYKHDGTETSEDSFSFTVTDGTHTDFYVFPNTDYETRKPQMMTIHINTVDNGVPQILVNKAAASLKVLPTGHLGFVITSKVLRSEDRDSPQKVLKYMVSEAPLHGFIMNTAVGNDSIKTFTQADINDMKICYVLLDGSNATSDIFYFTVEDNGGNKLNPQPFRLNWAWISLEREYYLVDEDAKFLEVTLKRRGYLGETSFVSIATKDGTAEKDKDFRGKAQKQVQFNPGQTTATWKVKIFTDQDFETSETFEIQLSDPVMAVLEFPDVATVEIVDPGDESTVYIPQSEFKIEEDVGELLVPVRRSGDASQELMVVCYTQQGTATGTIPSTVLSYSDYITRPEDHTSVLRFDKDEREKACRIIIIDDSLYEEEESFNVSLSMPMGGQVGANFPSAKVTILADSDDEPIIRFSEIKYSVREPQVKGEVATVKIPILRFGDTSKVSVVRVHTKDGSATSGEDYNPMSEDVEFKEGEKEHFVEIEVLYDGQREMREAFTVHMKPDDNMVAEIQMNKAIVYIEEMDSVADVTFPAIPQVVSLLMYDDTSKMKDRPYPPNGYPVVCVTACNPKYHDFDKTGSICAAENINDTLTQYRWLISAPTGLDGVTSPMREVDTNTFFTNTKSITLDSIYFQAGSRVQCAARAFNANGDAGLELVSSIVVISKEEGMCQPRVPGTVGAEPFSAKIRYTGPDDPDFPNLIKLTVHMPHMDGMLPVISTRPLSNFELTLSPDGTRVGNHRCSNLLDFNEIQTGYGFITDATKNPEIIGETSPYQYSVVMRSANSLRFYRNLNLEACLWEFTSYYDMSELLNDCGGSIGTDGQVLNLVQSYVTLRVPLFVSYVFHSPVAVGGWQHFDLQSELKLTFVYDTAILWQDGIGSPPEAELQGAMYPTSMRINEEGRLVVNFKTEARFRGQFVMSHPGTSVSSMVICADHSGLTFTLALVRTEPTYNQPMQQWSFVSDFAVRDYSGTYTVKLVPCIASPNGEFSIPPVCHPREPLTFDMDIRFQQVSDPVAAEFSLNTQMFLLSKKELWLSDGSMGFGEGTDAAFSEGSMIYGRVMVDPVQNLGDSFSCSIEKVFLCTGMDGYVPKYNPTNKEYGCLADAPSLLHRFKILDKAQPETQATSFGDVSFKATLAQDTPGALSLIRQPGTDGFTLSSSPLFQVAAGREWFIHTIYTVRSRENANRNIGKRSVEYLHHSISSVEQPRSSTRHHRAAPSFSAPAVAQDIGIENNRGTNIQHIALDRRDRIVVSQRQPWLPNRDSFLERPLLESSGRELTDTSTIPLLVGVAGLILLTCVIATVVILLLRRKKREKKSQYPPYAISSSSAYNGYSHSPAGMWGGSDSSEV
ncbi:FRAS1-related extracellular matrix protein 3 [Neolamprologus brichardi]|uniref:FRAS1-related extracellular matrix protein 3 n=1 Tax=Neolamprologus brichardi TaxID=32507 RepID=UPI0003EC672A|nr:FRAS1-related extracellular matrix protein 3 [Neolamprologus brichardi]